MRTIAVVNQKGGVGKTTTAVNLGAALALRGRRVLLVDMDPQGNLTDHLLDDPPQGAPPRPSVYDVLVEGLPVEKAVLATSTPGLFVVPSHEDLAGAELDLASVIGREVLLRDAMEALEKGAGGAPAYDYVLLDCPPSLGLLSLNALAAAHEVFIALQTEFFAMRGLGALDKTIDLVRRRINPALRVGGIVPTLVDLTRLSREVVDEVRGHYGDAVFASRIRSSVRLAEAPSHRKHVFDYAPESPGAADYAALAKEVEEGRAAALADAAAAAAAPARPTAPAAPFVLPAILAAPPHELRVERAPRPTPASSESASAESIPSPAPPVAPAAAATPPPSAPAPAGTAPAALVSAALVPATPLAATHRHGVVLPVLREGARGPILPPLPTRPASALRA